jgi:integrase/transposase-like protein
MRAKITKRPYTYKGKTEDRWLVKWTDLEGKRREKWLRNKRHAEAHATKIDRELADNVHVADRATITFAEVCKRWLKHEEGRADSRNRNADLAKGSLAAKQNVAKNHLLPFFGKYNLNKVTSPLIKQFVEDQARRVSHWTARRHKNLVKQVLDFAVENEWLRVSPLTNRPVKVPGTEPMWRRDDIPEVEDIGKLLDVVLNRPRPQGFNLNTWSSVQVQIVLGALLGLRPGEIGGLQWESVDLDKWTIYVEHSLSFYDGLKAPKTGSSYRLLDLEPVTHRVLQEHAERTIKGGLGRSVRARKLTGYVLTTAQNGCVMPTTMRWRHHNVMKLAGLVDANGEPHFTPHVLRHFAGSLWLAEGMTLKDVSWRLGHKSTKMTENVYLHQLRHDKRAKQVMNRVAAVRFPGIAGSAGLIPAMNVVDEIETPDKVIDLEATTVTALPPPMKTPEISPIRIDRPERYTAHSPGRRPRTLEDAPQWLDEALELLEQGYGLVEIARRLQRGEATVARWLKVAGVTKPGTYAHAVRTTDLEAKFAEMLAAGYQMTDIAYRLRVPLTTVKRWRAGRTPGNRLRRENERLENMSKQLKITVNSARAMKPNSGKMRVKQLNLL